MAHLDAIFSYIDQNKDTYIKNLSETVAIKSVSADPACRPEIRRMTEWVAERLKKLGTAVNLVELGKYDGLELPPLIFGQLGNDPQKKTILIYGHLDVQPASKDDGWDTEPFVLTEKNGKLFGRGSTDDKGPVLAWLHALEAYKATGTEIPVNLKFVFEGMEESGSEGLDEQLYKEKEGFLKGIDFVCISDNYWLGTKKPCLTYGLRGIAYFFIEVSCSDKDLHSGVFGGSVHEAMPDLIYLLNTLVDNKGKILVPGIMDTVQPLTSEEAALYDSVEFDSEEYQNSIGCQRLLHDNKAKTLMHRWRYPSLSIHGIQGAFYEDGAKTVIPRKVVGKFSMRLVPNQDPESIEKLVVDYLNKKFKERNSPNKFRAFMFHGGKPWMSDPKHPHYQAGVKAMKKVFGVEPDMTREGGSIPVTLTFQEVTQKNVMLLPIGAADDGAHSQNEKIDIYNYIEGTKVLAAYIHEASQI
uniref:Cytosolic non-specific dipeptidase n=1 Tax=Hemiscolopendra marginata TaxID=943146 RepID=A0A646QD11_9MYRI